MSIIPERYVETKAFLETYALLIKAAKTGMVIGYMDVAKIMGLPSSGNAMGMATGQMVGEISYREWQYGRPLLSAICVHEGDRKPGGGFYDLAQMVGQLIPGTIGKREFWIAEVKAVYDEWRK